MGLRDNPDIKIIFESNPKEDDVDFAKIQVKNTKTDKTTWTYKDDHGNEKETKVVTLQEYLKKYMLESTHETIRKSVLNATRNFNHRVKAFYRHVVKGSSNRMSIGFYNYRIEFQDRGAGHVHGVLWVDFDAFENNESNIEDFADKNEEEIGAGVKKLRSAFKKFKDDEVLSVEEYEKVTKFVDTFISCSTDPEIVQTKLYRIKRKSIYPEGKIYQKKFKEIVKHLMRLKILIMSLSIPLTLKIVILMKSAALPKRKKLWNQRIKTFQNTLLRQYLR